MIFSQYKETCEVLIDYPKIGGDEIIEDYAREAIIKLLHKNIDVHIRILMAELPKYGIKCIDKLQSNLIDFSGSSWQYFPDTGRSIGAYMIFYQGGSIDHDTHVPGIVAQSSAESEYTPACTVGMDLAHSRMFIHEFFNKDPYMFSEEDPLIVLDIKSDMRMAKKW